MKILNEIKINQQQKLTMTPEMLQSLNILRYTTQEVNDLIKEELVVNPVLEQYAQEYAGNYVSVAGKDVNTEDNDYEKYVSQKETLHDYVRLQLNLFVKDKKENKIGEYIVESLDDNGYMLFSADEIADRYKCSVKDVEKVLSIIQGFDPPGIAATSVRDCLLRQLKENTALDCLARKILEEYIDDMADNRLNVISKKLRVGLNEVQLAVDAIKHLNPWPGSAFESERTVGYIVPDIFVTEDEDGNLTVQDNQKSTPSLIISSYYKKVYQESEGKDEIRKYLLEKIDSAAALIKSVEQRRNTILRVSKAIVKHQQEFFRRGDKALKSLTLKDIAKELDVHESTVSRTVNGKYLQCSKGTYELKYFFSSKASDQSGDDVSSSSVKAYIREIIAEENVKKPYSDQKILEMLHEKGLDVSRRTIAKYRDEMGIPSSSKRKRY